MKIKVYLHPTQQNNMRTQLFIQYLGHTSTQLCLYSADTWGGTQHEYIDATVASHSQMDKHNIGHNYIGHNYVGDNYVGCSYAGHSYVGHNCTGHNYLGRGYMGDITIVLHRPHLHSYVCFQPTRGAARRTST